MGREENVRTILTFLSDREVALPPKPLHRNLIMFTSADFTYRTLKRTISDMEDRGLVHHLEKESGYYTISEKGVELLQNDSETDESKPFNLYLRKELEETVSDIEKKFPAAHPRVADVGGLTIGLWVRFNTQDDYSALYNGLNDVGDYLCSKGYSYAWAHDKERTPDRGTREHYEGHIYGLPAECGEPADPEKRLNMTPSHQLWSGRYTPSF